ncbi:MAG: Ig-like domain-containing protein [Chloroflexi bacterium]|nr:Ig-like domain-containing protein [Chloroflexota bacterium]
MVTKSILFILVLLMVIAAGCVPVVVPLVPADITVTVKDNGIPVSEVTITVSSIDVNFTEVLTTNDNGIATFSPGAVGEMYGFRPEKPTYSFIPHRLLMLSKGAPQNYNIEANSDTNTITTTVTENGEPLSGARLIIERPEGTGYMPYGILTDSNGEYVYLPDVGDGEYTITPWNEPYTSETVTYWKFSPESQTVDWDDSEPTSVRFTAEVSNRITVNVRDNNNDYVPGVEVTILKPNEDQEALTTSSYGLSHFTPDAGVDGTYTISVSKLGYGFDLTSQSVDWDGQQCVWVSFEANYIATTTINTTVKDNGIPISEVKLTINQPDNTEEIRYTDLDGTDNYPPTGGGGNNYTITPEKEGYSFYPLSRTEYWGGLSDVEVNFEANKNEITPTVSDKRRYLVNGVDMTILKPDGDTEVLTIVHYGEVTFDYGEGDYTVTPSKEGYTFNPTSYTFYWDGSSYYPIDFRATCGILITVTENGIHPVEGVKFTIVDQNGDDVNNLLLGTGDDGTILFVPDGDNGSYTITPSNYGGSIPSQTVDFLDSQPSFVTFEVDSSN